MYRIVKWFPLSENYTIFQLNYICLFILIIENRVMYNKKIKQTKVGTISGCVYVLYFIIMAASGTHVHQVLHYFVHSRQK